MRINKRITLMLALMLLVGFSLSAQSLKDMAGTWTGAATLETETNPNELTLILELQDGKLTGIMTDSEGAMDSLPIEEVILEKDNFSFLIKMEAMGVSVKFTMKVTGNIMKGELEVPEMGVKGTWEAAKQ